MEQQPGTSLFRVSKLKRFSYAAVGLLYLLSALALKLAKGDDVPLRLCAVIVPFAAAMSFYLSRISLKIDEQGISLYWPLQREKRLRWDEIAQVRRSDAPPGRYFFIDLIASPDRCVQFNPFFFDRPREIISELNRHLRFDLLQGDPAKEKQLSDELAAVAAEEPPGLSAARWIIIAALFAGLVIAVAYFFR